MFSVVLDKICVFCFYPIPDSQQYIKRGSCRRPILSGLLCLFLFWALGPFVTRIEIGPRTLSFSFIYFIESLSRFCISYLFLVYLLSVVKCHVVSFRIVSCFSYFFYVKCYLFYLIISCQKCCVCFISYHVFHIYLR